MTTTRMPRTCTHCGNPLPRPNGDTNIRRRLTHTCEWDDADVADYQSRVRELRDQGQRPSA